MSPLRRLLRAIDPRVPGGDDAAGELRASVKALRRDLRAMQGALADLGKELGSVHLQMQQLVALREEELNASARMDSLEPVLEADRAAGHVREAVARAALVDHPVPHVVISDVLPPDVLEAALEAIPSPIFFERSGGARELRVPPRFASTYSVATWSFVADLVNDALGPALVERFQGALDRHVATLCPSLPSGDAAIVLAAEPGRIVLREPGLAAPRPRSRPWHFLTTLVCLAPPDGTGTTSVRANSAVTVLDPPGARTHAPMPSVEAAEAAPCIFEFRIGPDTGTRRRMLARMDDVTRRAWTAAERAAG